MQNPMRFLAVLATAAVVVVFTAAPAAQAASCPAGTEPALTLKVPERAVIGRKALVRVGSNISADPVTNPQARLEMIDEQGAVFFSHEFTTSQLSDMDYDLK